jgi:hypothetical protein
MSFIHPSRRTFLQTSATITGALLFPTSIFAKTPDQRFFFIHTDTLNSWPVADPVQWSLENTHKPILERAADGLSKLTECDGDRIVRLVVRRCSLNLLEVHPGRVLVDHWGSNRADLKPFFKSHGLARPEIEVVLRDRKKETVSKLTGDSFLYGVLLASDFDLELFKEKWERRFEQEVDDWMAAPGTSSGFAFKGLPDGAVPWAALKSAWRSGSGVVCQDCSGPTLLVNFGLRQVGVFNRSPNNIHLCVPCRRSFVDHSVNDVGGWIRENIDAELWPNAEIVWGKRVKWEPRV